MSVFEELPSIFFAEMKAESKSEFAFLTDSSDVTVGIMSRPLRLLIRSSLMILHWVVSNNVLACSNTVSKNISFIVFATSIMNFSVREINDNLEAMAKQLYDYWFVQFDFPNEEGKPYKSSGGAMVYNEKLKREIPQGWHCYELNKWLEIKSGFAFKSETYISKGKFKVVTIKNVQDHHLDTSSCDYVNEIPHGMKEWCSLSVNDRLISLTGNCGRLCIVTEKDLLLNQRVGLLACNDEYIDYAYLLLSSEEYQTLSNNLAKGAAQANLSPVDLCKNVAVLPKLDVLEKFNRQIKPIVASYIQNDIQIADLTKQRDELLPLLMNGQATVNSD